MRDPREIIIRPIVTEATTEQEADLNAYTFVVRRDANKVEIRKAVQQLFGVQARKVRTMNYPGKWRRVGMNIGRRAGYKKAIVTLAEGERIDVYEGV